MDIKESRTQGHQNMTGGRDSIMISHVNYWQGTETFT
jgi:hypothetical protein